MAIKFKCPHCEKPLSVKDDLAGKRAKCPACQKSIQIPAPLAPPADLEAFAAAALAEQAEAPKEEKPPEFIELDCPMCGDPVKFAMEMAGKNAQCPSCKNIVKVPLPKVAKKKDWRDINKDGPAGARMNLPEQLEGAWGTEAKSRVGRESLEEAGALPEVQIDSIGVGGWIRRGVFVSVAAGAIVLLVMALVRNRVKTVETNAIADAHILTKEREKDPKTKLPAVMAATIELADGVLLLRQNKLDKARERFTVARVLISDTAKESALDQDLFLIDLARAQLEMGGTEDQIRTKVRYDWDRVVIKEIAPTLQRIKSPEALVIAIRDLGGELIARKQGSLAFDLAAKLDNPALADKKQISPLLVQKTAFVYFLKDAKMAEKLIPIPAAGANWELPIRLAYAEGKARKGEYDEAKKIALDNKDLPVFRFEPAVAVASAILSDPSNKEALARAAPFVAAALQIRKDELKNISPSSACQLFRAGMRMPEHAKEVKDLADRLPPEWKRRAQLDWLEILLEKGDVKADELIKEIPDGKGPTRCLAWMMMGRYLGKACPAPAGDAEDVPLAAVFVKIGQALGRPERTK